MGFQLLLFGTNIRMKTLQWRHNERDGVPNHQTHDCLLNRLFRGRSKKASKLRVTGVCVGNSPVTAQMASNAENISIWWRHHAFSIHSNKYVYLILCICISSVMYIYAHQYVYQAEISQNRSMIKQRRQLHFENSTRLNIIPSFAPRQD